MLRIIPITCECEILPASQYYSFCNGVKDAPVVCNAFTSQVISLFMDAFCLTHHNTSKMYQTHHGFTMYDGVLMEKTCLTSNFHYSLKKQER